jgi:hypothetical protein
MIQYETWSLGKEGAELRYDLMGRCKVSRTMAPWVGERPSISAIHNSSAPSARTFAERLSDPVRIWKKCSVAVNSTLALSRGIALYCRSFSAISFGYVPKPEGLAVLSSPFGR